MAGGTILNSKMKISISGISLLAVLLFISSCQSGTLYEKTIALPIAGWSQDNLVVFDVSVDDTIKQYEMSLIIRNDARYEYSNLFLFVNITAPGGAGIRDTVEIRMSDERGKWMGRGIGGKYTLKIPYKKQVSFPQKGTYKFEIEQGMREEVLEFITDVGFSINKLK